MLNKISQPNIDFHELWDKSLVTVYSITIIFLSTSKHSLNSQNSKQWAISIKISQLFCGKQNRCNPTNTVFLFRIS